MSNVVDQRVVEMRFDNKQFEANVAQSLTTLDKLKKSLNFNGASKGLDEINTASKKVDLSGVSKAADTISAKFSAMQVAGVTAIANLTNSAINSGKRIVSALTIDPVRTGFQEYETQINAVQTILANTQSKGTTLDQVNAALDELNLYADKTIYNFTEMTRNIGTFTAAGIDLDTSVNAIQGIANLAAVSGSTSQQASVAMYQLSQALASGTVKLMDWNSVVNAGMGGQIFQDALRKTSELLGTGAEAAIKAEGSFRESLSTGWLTSQVLTDTLKKFTTSGANEYVAEYTGLSKDAIETALEEAKARYGEAEAINYASEALAKKSGKNKEEIKSALAFAQNAEDAATKVKTLTQLWDTLKEAAQSGWTKTWEIIVGDFDEAKALFTDISNTVGDFLSKTANRRNDILKLGTTSNWDKLIQKIKDAGFTTNDFEQQITKLLDKNKINLTELIEKYGTLKDAIRAGAVSTDILKQAIKNLGISESSLDSITEKLGFGDRGDNVKAAQKALISLGYELKKFGADGTIGKETTEAIKAFQKASKLKVTGIVDDATLKALKEATKSSNSLVENVDDLVDGITELGGRELVLDSFKNIFKAIGAIIKPIGEAFRTLFPQTPVEEAAKSLNGAIKSFNEFTKTLMITEEDADNLRRTFTGLFSILKIITSVTNAGFSFAFKVVNKVLGSFNLNILDATAILGDFLTAVSDAILENDAFLTIIELVANGIIKLVEFINDAIDAVMSIPQVQIFIDKIAKAIENVNWALSDLNNLSLEDTIVMIGEAFKNAFSSLSGVDFKNVGKNIISGLNGGLGIGVSNVINHILGIGQEIINAFCTLMGIHSPSTVFYDFGCYLVQGLTNGVYASIPRSTASMKDLAGGVASGFLGTDVLFNIIKSFANKVKDIVSSLDLSNLMSLIPVGVLLVVLKKLYDISGTFADVAETLAGGLKGINSVIANFAGIEKQIANVIKAYGTNIKANALIKVAKAIAILAASIAVLALLPQDNLRNAVISISILSGLLIVLALIMDHMTKVSIKFDKGFDIKGIQNSLLSVAAVIAMLAVSIKILGTMEQAQIEQGFLSIITIMVILAVLAAAINTTSVKIGDLSNVEKIGNMLIKLAAAMVIMVFVCKLAARLSPEQMFKGALFAFGFTVFVKALMKALPKDIGEVDRIGKMVSRLSKAMILLVVFCALVDKLSYGAMAKGALFAGGFLVFVGLLVLISKLFPEAQIQKISGLVLSISFAMGLMVGLCKLISLLKVSEIAKGAAFAVGFALLVKLLVKVTTISSKEKTAQAASIIVAFSFAIAMLAGVSVLLGMVSLEGLAKGVTAVAILGSIMALMVYATSRARKCASTITVLAVVIALLAASVVALASIKDITKLQTAIAGMASLMAMFALLEGMSSLAKGSLATLIVLAVVVAGLAGIIYLLSQLPVNTVVPITDAFSNLILKLSASCVLLGVAGKLGLAAIGGIGIMIVVVAVMAKLMTKIGEIASGNDKFAEFINVSLPILEKIGYGLGSFFGNIIGGLFSGLLKPVKEFSTIISTFVNAIQPFLDFLTGNAAINEGAVNAVKVLTDVIMEITKASLLNAVTSFLTGGSSLTKFALQLVGFGIGMKAYGAIVSGINTPAILASALAAKALTQVANAIPKSGGIVSLFTGSSNLASFGLKLIPFGLGMKLYSLEVAGINTIAILNSAVAAQALSQVANAIPKSGGIMSLFTGSSNLASFGLKLIPFGIGMKLYSMAVTGINAIAILNSAMAAQALAQVANAIPKSGGLMQWINGKQDLGDFGKKLVPFGTGMLLYSMVVSGINTAAIQSSVLAAQAIVQVAESIPNSGGLKAIVSGDNDILSFGLKLIPFGLALKLYSLEVAGLNVVAIQASVGAAQGLVAVANAIPNSGGLKAIVSGDNDILSFGLKLIPFGKCMKKYAKEVSDLDPIPIEASIKAAQAMADLANSLPESSIIGSLFTGKKDLKGFGKALIPLGEGMKEYASSVADLNTVAITASAEAVGPFKKIINMIDELPTTGGIWGAIAGEKNLGGFGDALKPFGEGMKAYANSVIDLNAGVIEASVDAVKAIIEVSNAADGIPIEGGIWNFIAGEQDLGSFGTKMAQLGVGMKQYSDSVTGVSASVIEGSKDAVEAIVEVSKLFNKKLKLKVDQETVDTFRTKIVGIASAMRSYSFTVLGIDASAIASSKSTFNLLMELLKSVSSFKDKNVESFVSAINKLATAEVSKFVSVFTKSYGQLNVVGGNMIKAVANGAKIKQASLMGSISGVVSNMLKVFTGKASLFRGAGINVVNKIASGMKEQKSRVSSVSYEIVSASVSKLKDCYYKFYKAGVHVVRGFANGISDTTYLAKAKAIKMANAASEAAQKALDEHSPSKVFYKIGAFAGQGMVNALDDYSSKAYKSSYSVGDSARKGLANAINKISAVVDSDMELQPTIRPVMDLTEVQTGASMVSSMFNDRISVGATANLNAINASMSERIQNGGNADVVSAIGKLSKQLSNIGGNTYNVNGITYDDGSNISNAISDIIREARIERRM